MRSRQDHVSQRRGKGGTVQQGGQELLALNPAQLVENQLAVGVSAFAGRGNVLRAYGEAVGNGYRFYSYGDAMFIL